MEDRERVARLAERVRAPLADRATALAAVTHKSWVNEHRGEGAEDNERLEFLGDAVIDLLVSEYLMAHFPLAREGDLSKLRAAVVDEPGLAAMGRALQLGELLRLGRGEELTGGREKASVVADAMEAVIAAVFLDGGLAAVHRLIDPFLEEAYARAASGAARPRLQDPAPGAGPGPLPDLAALPGRRRGRPGPLQDLRDRGGAPGRGARAGDGTLQEGRRAGCGPGGGRGARREAAGAGGRRAAHRRSSRVPVPTRLPVVEPTAVAEAGARAEEQGRSEDQAKAAKAKPARHSAAGPTRKAKAGRSRKIAAGPAA